MITVEPRFNALFNVNPLGWGGGQPTGHREAFTG